MTESVKKPLQHLGALLKERGMTQAELSRQTDLSPGQLSLMISGQRGYSRESINRIAAALKVSPAEILQEDARATPIRSDAEAGSGETQLLPDILRALAPDASAPAIYVSGRAIPGANISTGDQLIVDLKRTARLGDLVLAQVVDPDTSASMAVIRRWIDPHLVETGVSSDAPVITISNGQFEHYWCNILGPIIAVIRLLPGNERTA